MANLTEIHTLCFKKSVLSDHHSQVMYFITSFPRRFPLSLLAPILPANGICCASARHCCPSRTPTWPCALLLNHPRLVSFPDTITESGGRETAANLPRLSSDKTFDRKSHKTFLAKCQMALALRPGQSAREGAALCSIKDQPAGLCTAMGAAGFHWAGRMGTKLISVIIPEFISTTEHLECAMEVPARCHGGACQAQGWLWTGY